MVPENPFVVTSHSAASQQVPVKFRPGRKPAAYQPPGPACIDHTDMAVFPRPVNGFLRTFGKSLCSLADQRSVYIKKYHFHVWRLPVFFPYYNGLKGGCPPYLSGLTRFRSQSVHSGAHSQN